MRQGYTRIAVAGDSAGAGLAIALMQYLARLSEKEKRMRPPTLTLPRKACFYSPWADLTFSHEYGQAVYFDISTQTRSCGGLTLTVPFLQYILLCLRELRQRTERICSTIGARTITILRVSQI